MEKIKRARGISLVLMFIMVFQLMMPVNFAYGAEKITVADISGAVEVYKGTTKINPEPDGSYKDIPTGAKIKINYEFKLPNEPDYTSGDYIEIPLPDSLKFTNSSGNILMDGDVVATYSISNASKVIRITFNEFVEQKSNIEGNINLEGTFEDADELGGGSKSIEIEYVGTFDFEFEPKEVDPGSVGITKSGVYDPETGKITWTIIVRPDDPADVVTVVDTIIGTNHEFLGIGDVTVTSGSGIGVDVTSPSAITYDGNNKITFALGSITGEHTITFKTKPKAGVFEAEDGTSLRKESVLFENGAIVKIGEEEVDRTKAEVNIDWIQKSGKLEPSSVTSSPDGNRIITWTINVNNKGYTLNTPVVITDYIPAGLTLYEAPEVTVSGSAIGFSYLAPTLETSGEHNGKTKLTITLDDTLNSKATITYQTEIDDWETYLMDNRTTTFKNQAFLTWDEIMYGSPSDIGEVTIIGSGGIISKSAEAKRIYNDKNNGDLINWTAVVNRNKANIEGEITFTDSIPAELSYELGSFKVFDSSNNDVTGSVGSFSFSSGTLRYVFNIDTFKTGATYTIKFTTKIIDKTKLFVNSTAVGYSNTARVTGSAINWTSTGTQYFESKVIEKSRVGNHDYHTKQTTWKVVINHNNLTLENAKLVDVIPDGWEYVPGSFAITSPSGMHATLVREGAYNPNPTYDNATNNELTFNFGTIDQRIEVEFKTKITDSALADKGTIPFTNRAKLTSSTFPGITREATATVSVENPIVEKNGVLINDDAIKWTVPINANSMELLGTSTDPDDVYKGISLTDVLNNSLTLDVSSVKLYKAELDNTSGSNLTLKKVGTDPLVASTEYVVEYDKAKDNTFTFTFKEKIDSPYILEFITSLDNSANINNKITLRGSGLTGDKAESDIIINFNRTDAAATGTNGTLTVKKVDESGNPLNGAEFRIYRKDKDGNVYTGSEKTGITGTSVDGEILFDSLLYKTYFIEETGAPKGYVLDTETEVRIIHDENKNPVVEFTNTKIIEFVEFTKADNSSTPQPLSGAEFELYEMDGSGDYSILKGTVTTGTDGKVRFDNLSEGNYKIIETKSPVGYEDLRKEVFVSIVKESDQKTVTKTVTGVNSSNELVNELVPVYGNIELDKLGLIQYKDGSSIPTYVLPGAEFSLKEKNENSFTPDGGSSVTELTATSDIDGKVKFENIPEGDYVVEEASAPLGYTKSDKVVNVNIVRNSAKLDETVVTYSSTDTGTEQEIVNKSINIEFTKEDSNGNPLEGAEFTLYEADGTTVFKGPVSSNAEGRVVFTAIPAGTYTIKETKAPSGYRDFNGAIEVEVKVEDEGTVATVTFTEKDKSDSGEVEIGEDGTLVVTNERRPSPPTPIPVYGKIVIKKTDEDKKVLPGAEFTLYDEGGRVVERGVTGSDGTLSFEDLEPGSYTIKETKAPEGYVLEVDERGVTVSANRTNTYTFTNKKEEPKKPGRIEIVKVDEEGRLLSDAWFSLIDGSGTTLENVVTVDGRAAFEDVPVGRYTIKEVQAPEGYVLTEQEVNVTVDSEETVTVRFVNKQSGTTVVPVSGRITINKVNENNMALAGAEFTLYNENNEIVGTAVSDASGRVIFENLKDGRYFVRETEAPAGYRIVSDSLTVNVTGGSSHSYRFRNVPDTEEIDDPEIPLGWEEIDDPDVPRDVLELPDTGSLLNTWLMITIGLMLIFAGLFLFRTKLTNN
ncbi:hypothetical protein HZF24_17795 [Sedimentibacter hydroxybenzoicus DSM 7310]|uniref:LPXTG-motif cell wall anchor domain-containing protein n=1 Tax=Sedimentibacter hydroxybenzoicus DSM 7310 TaxID=1123245 RepID=A0A974BN25_SEDHY|nr:SpaA isopeptide-forming pilin-related protein [Sedimentibacter hydroxybenzoicus]NYB76003.1 hypothetical protein [Sedimentibacter hydroxybenzoicus DSM 7310]